MKTLTGVAIGLVASLVYFYAVDVGLMKTQGLELFPETAAEAKKSGGH